jgi:hypothetical protein
MQRRDQFRDSRLNPAARAINSIYDRCIARDDARWRCWAMCTAVSGNVSIVTAPVTAQATKSAPARL